jgi:succinoglycan biosynthesis transport protein ExoP
MVQEWTIGRGDAAPWLNPSETLIAHKRREIGCVGEGKRRMNSDGFETGASAVRGETIDFVRLSRALVRRKWWIVGPTLASLALALVFVMTASPRYTGVAKVLLENQESYFTRPDKATAEPEANFDPEGVQSQAETVSTTELARQAVDKLGLAERDEFNPKPSASPLAILFPILSGGRAAGAGQERVVDAFLSRLTVFPVPKSRVLQIEFVSSDPALAARGANTVAALYLAEQEDAKKDEAKTASAWLSEKIGELRAKVAEADAKAEAFRAKSGLFAGANGLTAPTQQLSDLNTQLAAARARQADATAKAQSLRAMLREGRLEEAAEAARDDSLRRYGEQRVALKAQIAQESRTLLPQHPRMKELAGELAGLDAEIRVAATKAVLSLEDDAKLAGAEVDNLNGALANQSKTVATGDADEAQLRALELDANTAREQLESYLQKYREALAREADNVAPADARIIASATEPRTPTFPKKGPTVLLATLAGFLISLGVVAAHALYVDGAGEAKGGEAARAAEGEEGDSGEQEHPLATSVEPTQMSEGPDRFRSPERLADRLAETASDDGGLAVLLAGDRTSRALGHALAAARALTKCGRAVLVDLGVSQDWLADAIDREAENGERLAGLAELLDGRATFEEALHRDLSSRLDIIPAGAGAIDDEGLSEVIAALASSYDFVVLHASDWRSAEVGAAVGAVAVFVMVAPEARLEAALQRLRERLADLSVTTLGLVSGDRAAVERAA